MLIRSSGVLLHVSSLPGPFGIGDIGPRARTWIDWLAASGCRYWQVLPLGPAGSANSPFSSSSSFAGNVNLISPELLVDDLQHVGTAGRVDYPQVIRSKQRLLQKAHSERTPSLDRRFVEFREQEEQWLADYSLFMAVKEAHKGAPWYRWSDDLRRRQPDALRSAAGSLADEISKHSFGQFVFHEQLELLRAHAAERGVQIIGDVPLYVATDSVDVWLDPELFDIDLVTGEPASVAGVPPDRFSPVGQVWGTPTYRWDVHRAERFRWWIDRIGAFLRHADVLRIDHFTGFCRYYAIDAVTEDPLNGEWREGPGAELFDALTDRFGPLPLILEDLGPLGDEVEELRRQLGYPGMRVLQEAFGEDLDGTGRPDKFPKDCVVYTGTHDNDTAKGRFDVEDDAYRERALDYTRGSAEDFAWDLVAKAWESVPVLAIAPMQDLLGLGGEARMNLPGTTENNWEWRMAPDAADEEMSNKIAGLNRLTGRHVDI